MFFFKNVICFEQHTVLDWFSMKLNIFSKRKVLAVCNNHRIFNENIFWFFRLRWAFRNQIRLDPWPVAGGNVRLLDRNTVGKKWFPEVSTEIMHQIPPTFPPVATLYQKIPPGLSGDIPNSTLSPTVFIPHGVRT